ncbi:MULTISPECIES: NAD(P)H-dependent flavin oxidoreductase [unclassified Nocardioides]|uniref:NAD(P)H-dependent flavin oxidoreductase n=1 Tax=unclassified Nocardioides TaxID=2615069 RepID=UPI0006F9F664|nr:MULTISPECIES: nitronate monooxygenase [unclassified Nocardioides]KQY57214.1 2-nitropropane dioxygenase [Nocardioides sp. Root140]KQZ68729.1 2-nitropropane dioxygenase [Nocardioides sp. Root151]KRF11858.1 2-nitropropane dioxygenase [Nocardioides sp. Soil796]
MSTATTDFGRRLTVPLVAAPMTGVSGPELVVSACRNGVIGSFPTHNARDVAELDTWLSGMRRDLADAPAAPIAPNLVVHRTNARLHEDTACLVEHGIELVITSVGSPTPVLETLHASGCQVYADVATLAQARKAADAGVDGLVLLSAGAGGQTGAANPFAFVRAVREFFAGTVVLAGGVSDGVALLAARVLGADLAYMGTPFIATRESLASQEYRSAVVEASMDDVRLSDQVGGLPASLLAQWLEGREAGPVSAGDFQQERLVADPSVWSAGHGVTSIREVVAVDELVARVRREYDEALIGLSALGAG